MPCPGGSNRVARVLTSQHGEFRHMRALAAQQHKAAGDSQFWSVRCANGLGQASAPLTKEDSA
jgi:hypothetical protein